MKKTSLDFNKIFDRIALQKPKATINETHLYADYIELKVLFLNGDEFTLSDLIELVKDERWSIYGKDDIEYMKLLKDNDNIGSDASFKEDFREATARRVFDLLRYRQELFLDKYPFLFYKNRLSLKENLNINQKIYLFLLLSSKLEDFGTFKTFLTNDFEKISKFALKAYLPTNTEVFEIGKNSELRANITRNKIIELSKKIPIAIDIEAIVKNIHYRSSQEDGLDIIAWIPFNDIVPNKLIFLCQCACGKNWKNKMNDMNSYHSYLKFYKIKPIDIMFTSYSLIDSDDKFFQDVKFKISGILMFERKRILEQISDSSIFLQYDSHNIVNNCINYLNKNLV